MKKSRRKFTPEFKSKVAIDALREHETIEVLCRKYDLHPSQINGWKKELKENSVILFSDSYNRKQVDLNPMIDELYKQIGQLTVANEFLKKKLQ